MLPGLNIDLSALDIDTSDGDSQRYSLLSSRSPNSSQTSQGVVGGPGIHSGSRLDLGTSDSGGVGDIGQFDFGRSSSANKASTRKGPESEIPEHFFDVPFEFDAEGNEVERPASEMQPFAQASNRIRANRFETPSDLTAKARQEREAGYYPNHLDVSANLLEPLNSD